LKFSYAYYLPILFFGLQDIARKVVAQEINPEDTPVSKVTTRNPVFVLSETLAVEALQKMVQGWYCI
jgi:CBS domain-containing protein